MVIFGQKRQGRLENTNFLTFWVKIRIFRRKWEFRVENGNDINLILLFLSFRISVICFRIKNKFYITLRSKEAGRFETLLDFSRSHPFLTRGWVSLSCATTQNSSCFCKSSRYFKSEIGKNFINSAILFQINAWKRAYTLPILLQNQNKADKRWCYKLSDPQEPF